MAQTAQELSDDFLLHVGSCVTQWADIEQEIFEVCLSCLSCSRERAAIIYYRTPTIDARLTLADELIATVLPKRSRLSGGHDHDDVKKWKKLESDIRLALKTRNRIAHQPVGLRSGVVLESLRLGNQPARITWFELYMSENEQTRGRKSAKPMRLDDLKNHFRMVLHLRAELNTFRSNTLAAHVAGSPQLAEARDGLR